ncbi:hypothetical protein BJ166DRAFT_346312 [Pestalotiopsis sp. NC0098]|nr:hypothetical protein BJ166DRAFT_346312 [Pestalotiopsis sp. NC0098]
MRKIGGRRVFLSFSLPSPPRVYPVCSPCVPKLPLLTPFARVRLKFTNRVFMALRSGARNTVVARSWQQGKAKGSRRKNPVPRTPCRICGSILGPRWTTSRFDGSSAKVSILLTAKTAQSAAAGTWFAGVTGWLTQVPVDERVRLFSSTPPLLGVGWIQVGCRLADLRHIRNLVPRRTTHHVTPDPRRHHSRYRHLYVRICMRPSPLFSLSFVSCSW